MGNLICLQKIEYNGISEVICPKNKDLIIDKFVKIFPLLALIRPTVSDVFDEKFVEYLQNMEYLTSSNLWQVLESKEYSMEIMYDLFRTFIPGNIVMIYNDDRSKIVGTNFFNEITEIENEDLKNLEKCGGKHMYKADRFIYINRGFNIVIKLFNRDYFDCVDITEDGELTDNQLAGEFLVETEVVFMTLIELIVVMMILAIVLNSGLLQELVTAIETYVSEENPDQLEGVNEQKDEKQKFDPKRWLSHDDEFYRLHAQYFVNYATEEQKKSAEDFIRLFNLEYTTKHQAKVLFQIAFDSYMENKDLKAGTSYKEIEGNFLSGLRSSFPNNDLISQNKIIELLVNVASILLY